MPAPRSRLASALLIAAVVLAAGTARAQTTSSALTGVVRSGEGALVSDAVVHARSEATGVVRTVVTDARGRYRIDGLAPGAWSVVAQLPGGQGSEPRAAVLALQQTVKLDFVVIGEITETVTVRAEAPIIDPQQSGGELRLARARVDAVPVHGGAITDLALVDSSVRTAPPGGFTGERGAVFVVNGQSGRGNSFLVDGLDNNDQVSGTTLNSYFSEQVIREFVVLTHGFLPEFGRASGGVLNIITDRGGNAPTAEVFFQGASAGWNAPGGFVSSLPRRDGEQDTTSRFQAGVKYGGPLKRDRSFFFGSYEHQQSQEVLPYSGITRDGVPGGWMLAPAKDDNLFLRTDFNFGEASTLMVRLSGDRRQMEGLNVIGRSTPEAGFHLEEQDWQLASSLTTVFSSSVINEARVLGGWSSFGQDANSSRPGVSHPTGDFGGNYLNRQARDEMRLQVVDNVTVRAGAHTLKGGVDVTRSRTKMAYLFNPNGSFLYNTDRPFQLGDCDSVNASDVDPNNSFGPIPCRKPDGSFGTPALLGTFPVVFSLVEGAPRPTLDDTRLALFAQDDWQVHAKFRVGYGFRYDLSTFRLPDDSRVTVGHTPNGGAGVDRDNIAPRLDFSYTPFGSGRFVLRGGAGIFYDKLVLAFPALAAIMSRTRIQLYFPQALNQGITENTVEQYGIDVIRQGVVFAPQYTMYFSTGTKLDTPYNEQFSLGADWETGRSSALRLDLVRALGHHLPLMKDLNPVERIDNSGTTRATPVHNDSDVGSIAAVVTEGRSWYTGATLLWQWQHRENAFSASYTWSLAQDEGPDPLKDTIGLPPQSRDLSLERARSDADRRHRVTLFGQTELPWFGVKVSALVQAASGAPFNVTTGRDDNLDGILSDRPPGLGRNTGADTPLAVVNAIREQENRRYYFDGNGALPMITSLEAPYFLQVDLKLQKTLLPRRARKSGAIYLQVANLFDRTNGGLVDGRIISRTFGRPIALAGPPRTFELGLRGGF